MSEFLHKKAAIKTVFLLLLLQVDRPRLLDDVRADDQLEVRAEDGEEATHGRGPRQAREGET